MITMNIDQHTYTHEIYGLYDSVSKLKSSIVNPFDSEYWLDYKALELLIPNFKLLKGKSPKPPLAKFRSYVSDTEFLAARRGIEVEWAAKAVIGQARGTNYHDMKEALANRTQTDICPYDGKAYHTRNPHDLSPNSKRSLLTHLDELEVGCCYPELIIWNDAYHYAGTLDRVYKLAPKKVFILDYKTDRKFRTENMYNKLLAPVSHLEETELNIYGIQIGLYALPFHQCGYTIVGCEIHHNFMGLEKTYPIPVMLKEADAVAASFYYSRKNLD